MSTLAHSHLPRCRLPYLILLLLEREQTSENSAEKTWVHGWAALIEQEGVQRDGEWVGSESSGLRPVMGLGLVESSGRGGCYGYHIAFEGWLKRREAEVSRIEPEIVSIISEWRQEMHDMLIAKNDICTLKSADIDIYNQTVVKSIKNITSEEGCLWLYQVGCLLFARARVSVLLRTRVFEQEIQGASKTSSSAQNVAFVSQSKSSTNKVKSGFSGAYSSCTPSTSSTNIPEKEVPLADDDVDIEEMDINWQIAKIAYSMKIVLSRKQEGEFDADEKHLFGFDKKKLNVSICQQHWSLPLGNVTAKVHKMAERRRFFTQQETGKAKETII
ncbi:hypothetical protein Tco_0122967 [Tanacetum coccineum]